MIRWPEKLITDLARRKATLVLGSGISRNSTNANGRYPKTWSEFLYEQRIKVFGREYTQILKRYDYLTACEMLKKEIGPDNFRNLLIDEYLTPGYAPNEYHHTIFKLDSRIVLTPNFDKIYESYANSQASGSIRVKNHYDDDVADAIRREDRLILKFHGTIDSPDKMIFTRREYAEARTKFANFYKIVEALALTHTFIFIGCGVHDPDTRLLMEDIFFRYENIQPHVFILPKGALKPREKSVVENSMNLSVLEYKCPNNDHSELLLSIKDLVSKVEIKREDLASTRNW